MDVWHILLDVVLLLGASLVVGGLFSRFGQSPLVGYLLVGMVFGGPGSFGVVRSGEDIEAIAELGVSLLLFSLGLEFSWNRLRSLGGRILLAGTLQVLVTGGVGFAIASAFGLNATAAVAVGAMVALSSTASVLRVLMDRGELDDVHGRNSLAILLVQDIAVVPLAVLVSVLGGDGDAQEIALRVGRIVALAAGLIASLYVVLNVVAVRALGTLTIERNRELTVLLAVVAGLGSTWAAHAIGISPALGAFVAGLFLGSSPFATQIRADVASLRVVLLTLFFGAAGMVADPLWIATHAPLVLAVSAVLLLVKAVIVWGVLRAVGLPHQVGVATGLCLSQIGEFAFVLGNIARDNGAVAEETHLVIVSATIVTLFATPFLVPLAPRVGVAVARLLRVDTAPTTEADFVSAFTPEAVVIGFGPAGQAAASALVGRAKVLVIDLNLELVRKAEEFGFHGHVGDATQAEVLEHAHAGEASLVLITIPSRQKGFDVLQLVRRLCPEAHVVVRSRYHRDTRDFELAGADAVFGDEESIGQRLARHLEERFTGHSRGGDA